MKCSWPSHHSYLFQPCHLFAMCPSRQFFTIFSSIKTSWHDVKHQIDQVQDNLWHQETKCTLSPILTLPEILQKIIQEVKSQASDQAASKALKLCRPASLPWHFRIRGLIFACFDAFQSQELKKNPTCKIVQILKHHRPATLSLTFLH